MAAQERNDDFELTRDDLDRFSDALKDKEFRKLFVEYCDEIQDPANRALYQAEITELEKQRGVNVTFINPSPGYVIKTSVAGEKKAFINVCSNENVDQPSSSIRENSGKRGVNWCIPHTMAPPHDDFDKSRTRCVVYDVVFHPNTLRMAGKNAQFKKMLDDTACDAVEKNHHVKLDRKNLKFPKLPYKGVPIPSIVRKADETFTGEATSKSVDSDILDKLYPQNSFPATSNTSVDSSKVWESTEEKTDCSFTVPKYVIKQRRNIDITEFTYEKDAKQNTAIPSELIIEVKLPLLSSTAEAKLDVKGKKLTLLSETPARYKLDLALPYAVDDEAGSAKFDLTKKLLVVTLPVIMSERTKVVWRYREDSGVESGANSSCGSDEDNSHSLVTEKLDVQSSDNFCESEAYRTNGAKTDEFLDPDVAYLIPPNTCHVLDSTLALTLHVKNVDPESVISKVADDTFLLKFSSVGAGYFPIHHALCLKFPEVSKLNEPAVETWDNNVIVMVEFADTHLPECYYIGLEPNSLEKKELDVPADKIIRSAVANSEATAQPIVEVTARGNNEINISLTMDSEIEKAEEITEEKNESIMIPVPKTTEDHYDSGIASSNGSSKGILKFKPRVGRSFSESSVDFVDYCGSPAYSISSADCIPEESSSLKKTVRFSNVIAKQTFRTNASILGQKSKNQRKKRNKKRALDRRASEGDPEDSGSQETVSDENVFSGNECSDHNGNTANGDRRDSVLTDTDDGDEKDSEDNVKNGNVDNLTFKMPSSGANKGKYQDVKFKSDLIFELDM